MRPPVLLALILVLPGCLGGARPTADAWEGSLVVVVQDFAAAPIANATVSIPALGRNEATDIDGRAVFPALGAGPHILEIRAPRHETVRRQVTVTVGQETLHKVILGESKVPPGWTLTIDAATECRRPPPPYVVVPPPCANTPPAILSARDPQERRTWDPENVTFKIQWSGIERFELEWSLRLGGRLVPLAPGIWNRTASGGSPILVHLSASELPPHFRVPGASLAIRAVRPLSAAPEGYDQAFYVVAQFAFASQTPIEPQANRTTPFSQTFLFPGAGSGQSVNFFFPISRSFGIPFVHWRVEYQCPQRPAAYDIRLLDPVGREVQRRTLALPQFSFEPCTPGAWTRIFFHEIFPWSEWGNWRVQGTAECSCRVNVTVSADRWPGLQ